MTPIHIVLVQPDIPQNTGAVGRLCVNLDCRLHLIRPLGFSLEQRQLRRAGMDYWDHLDLTVHDTWQDFLDAETPDQMVFLSTRGSRSFYDVEVRPHAFLIFGSESRGLPEAFYTRYESTLASLPAPGANARSLNLANAAAIAAYEVFRQLSC